MNKCFTTNFSFQATPANHQFFLQQYNPNQMPSFPFPTQPTNFFGNPMMAQYFNMYMQGQEMSQMGLQYAQNNPQQPSNEVSIPSKQQPQEANLQPEEAMEENQSSDANSKRRQEDQKIEKLGSAHQHDWKAVAKKLRNPQLTPIEAKRRFDKANDKTLKLRVKFVPWEDVLIARLYQQHGTNWGTISLHFPHREPVMLKNRYYAYIRKQNMLEELAKLGEGLTEAELQERAQEQLEKYKSGWRFSANKKEILEKKWVDEEQQFKEEGTKEEQKLKKVEQKLETVKQLRKEAEEAKQKFFEAYFQLQQLKKDVGLFEEEQNVEKIQIEVKGKQEQPEVEEETKASRISEAVRE